MGPTMVVAVTKTRSTSPIGSFSPAPVLDLWCLIVCRGIYGANFQPQQLPGDKVTRILYAFADIGSDGEV